MMLLKGLSSCSFSRLSKLSAALLKNKLTSQSTRIIRTAQYSLLRPWECEVSPRKPVPDNILKPLYATTGYPGETREDIEIKTPAQIDSLRAACLISRNILKLAGQAVKPGVTTDEIDDLVHRECIAHNVYPSPLNYHGFPKSVCTSVNNVACHGIPDSRPLEDGDIINIDITVYHNGHHGDCSETFCVGSVDTAGQRLVEVARLCRDEAIKVCHDGAKFSDIGNKISEISQENGFSVMPMFCGHGIGQYFHGPPDIIHIANRDETKMARGMTFTVEPVISEGGDKIFILEDGWTAMSTDESRSAQFEHTILITDGQPEILTA